MSNGEHEYETGQHIGQAKQPRYRPDPLETVADMPMKAGKGLPTWAVVVLLVGAALVMLCCVATVVMAVFGDADQEPKRPPTTLASAPADPPPSATVTPSPDPVPQDTADLEGQVTVWAGNYGLTMLNRGEHHWTSCELDLNRGLVRAGYTFKGFELYPAGTEGLDRVWIKWESITDRNARRFDPDTMAPETLTIQCQLGGRSSVASYEW